jgi:hypothetical protein
MLLPVALPVLPKIITLLLTDRHAEFDIVDGELEWGIDLTVSCGAA